MIKGQSWLDFVCVDVYKRMRDVEQRCYSGFQTQSALFHTQISICFAAPTHSPLAHYLENIVLLLKGYTNVWKGHMDLSPQWSEGNGYLCIGLHCIYILHLHTE